MSREPLLGAVCGRKRIGKTVKTIEYIRHYVKVSPRRKALIYDVTGEYSDKSKYPDIKTISLESVPQFALQNYPEICRIEPFFDSGKKMTHDDMSNVLLWILNNYYNGLLLLEDINKYVEDQMPGDLIGAICTNAHYGLDIILHFQSVGRITRKVWQNLNWIRMHKNTDSVTVHKDKFKDKYEYLKIAELIVNHEYRSGNIRYYLFVDIDNEKIYTGLPEDVIKRSIIEYASSHYAQAVGDFVYKRDGNGKQLYTEEQAFQAAIDQMYQDYFAGTA